MDINTNYSLNSGISMKGNLQTIEKALNRYDKRMLESQFDKLVRALPTKEGDVIDRNALDNADKKVFDKLKMCFFEYYGEKVSMTLKRIKQVYSGYLVNVKDEMYNNTPATVARFIDGGISSVKTSATNAKDAARLMGLDRYYMPMGGNEKAYYHEVLNDAGKVVARDCFTWDSKTKSMKWFCGLGRSSENKVGVSPIQDYKNSY